MDSKIQELKETSNIFLYIGIALIGATLALGMDEHSPQGAAISLILAVISFWLKSKFDGHANSLKDIITQISKIKDEGDEEYTIILQVHLSDLLRYSNWDIIKG